MGGMMVKRCEWEQKGKKRVDGIQYWRGKCPYEGFQRVQGWQLQMPLLWRRNRCAVQALPM